MRSAERTARRRQPFANGNRCACKPKRPDRWHLLSAVGTKPPELGSGNCNQRTVKQTQLPRPNTKCDDSTARNLHSIPKARKTKNGFEYYIIYKDQSNKKIGEYVPENKLTQNKKAYIEMHKDKIRILRHLPRININSLHLNNNN